MTAWRGWSEVNFHHYLRHKGRLPVRLANKPEIISKWEFIEWMAGKSARRW